MKQPSLRERKKIAAMHTIQEAAVNLFERDGFDAVTIDQVAAEADVSPSTVYRYFGTKEGIVLWNPHQRSLGERLDREVTEWPPLEAMRRAVSAFAADAAEWDEERDRRRMRHLMETTLSRHTNRSAEQIRIDTDRDKILTAEDALEYGMIDQVFEYRKLNA